MKERRLGFNLEPTFRCNLGCEMCPRFSSEDPHLDMSMEVYERICDAMAYAHNVDFTGWGEPLLHKRIYEMVAMAKRRGCATSMTTNGTALTERNSRRLIEAGMDRLTVSIDGLTPETYDVIRVGASLEKVRQNLRGLADLIEQSGSAMELGIAFTIQESNASQIGQTADWAHEAGAQVLHLKHLNVPSNAEDWQRSLLKYRLRPRARGGGNGFAKWPGRASDPLERAERDLRRAVKRASKLGLEAKVHSELPLSERMRPRHCLAAPLEAVYFSFEGKVAPCCHFGHHVSRYFQGDFHPPSSLYYGDIRRERFEDIWHKPAFADFRQGFQQKNYPEQCRTCYLLYGK